MKQVEFKLNDHILLRHEITLVEYDGPLVVVCTDDADNKYLVFYLDEDTPTYLIVLIDSDFLVSMLNKTITMRDAVLSGTLFWKIVTAELIDDDKIYELEKSELHEDDLPEPDFYFSFDNVRTQEYANSLMNYSKNKYLKRHNTFLEINETAGKYKTKKRTRKFFHKNK